MHVIINMNKGNVLLGVYRGEVRNVFMPDQIWNKWSNLSSEGDEAPLSLGIVQAHL